MTDGMFLGDDGMYIDDHLGSLMAGAILFFHILGIVSSQVTNSYFSEGLDRYTVFAIVNEILRGEYDGTHKQH